MTTPKPALPEPVPPNAEGSTTCIVRWMVTTRDGLWLGAWDKEAFAAYTQAAIDAAVAQYEQGADVEARLGDEARAEVKRLREAVGHEMTTKLSTECHWSQDGEDSDVWATQCGHYFVIAADTPSYNEMRFCCFCGRPLVEIRFEDEP